MMESRNMYNRAFTGCYLWIDGYKYRKLYNNDTHEYYYGLVNHLDIYTIGADGYRPKQWISQSALKYHKLATEDTD
jgi:hypothetical protein